MAVAFPLSELSDSLDLRRTYTAEELFAFPSDCHYELVRGKLRSLEMPTGGPHGAKTNRFTTPLSSFIYEYDLGECFAAETGFLLSQNPDTVLAPDFAFVKKAKLPEELPGGYVRAIPDLVLETRSPSDRPREISSKVREWLDAGVQLVLELNPAKQVLTIYRPNSEPEILTRESIFDGGTFLPGFVLPLTRLFPQV
ncbi:Uma2 family endonuclease [Armatimonas sp.]|uniref:Uma2 family endonuclease n=1 Tax=Armatimonas sp. TaxID=1872638 RepID=UPI0037514761